MGPDTFGPYALLLRRRGLFAACLVLVLIALLVMLSEHAPVQSTDTLATPPPPPSQSAEAIVTPAKDIDPLGPKHTLHGSPTASFRDNLLPQHKYITSWLSAGWTNDVYTYINLIYLGLITDRIPIVPMFIPSHVGGHVPPIPFGEVFDVPRLRNEIGKSVLEWRDVKDINSTEIDDIGCWNVWESVQYREAFPRRSRIPDDLNLDISYTKTPEWIKMIPNYEHDQHVTFWSLATLAFPTTRKASLVPPLPSPKHNVSLPPDEHLLCYDYLYYVSAHQPFEMEYDYVSLDSLSQCSPAWRYVGTHMHWTPTLEKIADEYIRKALGVADDSSIPPFISLHIRRLDFKVWCNDVPIDECFAPLSVIERRVREVQDEITKRTGMIVPHVLVTSDERSPEWWHDVAKQGWFSPDHTDTKEHYGEWYPVLIDAVIQSRGVGFVGTDRSTMSIIAARRVEDWSNGPHRLVKWGTKDADDH
ncbi:hypothetical protein MIND_00497500 [Mycena indigotica]|uniref:O-fucosyltransferase family protein n=1 Tax=Mycena indigotica TaxID=2126181 RepID=A0A8H6WC70_9AGAR|nr:uncharacterized protein MIND_00497500 [Mycena indigotica]KAF7307044.1 hypothetical protein MIND_00497500 [Mycena indigotica]